MKYVNSKTCGQCKYFIGAGDWNLCCTQKHLTPEEKAKGQYFLYVHLCYKDIEACDLFEEKI